ncbi:hypothetical protein HMPREF0005_02920 [Achromobacter xylosoxidans C54]|nr:hypothetical protein HMPREF0005_02920 [Achromobacter xylosoxidans C54]CCH10207.1 hypothetical protein NH44784_062701 [Achromobacter xylosoxidans NH44784-1996]
MPHVALLAAGASTGCRQARARGPLSIAKGQVSPERTAVQPAAAGAWRRFASRFLTFF